MALASHYSTRPRKIAHVRQWCRRFNVTLAVWIVSLCSIHAPAQTNGIGSTLQSANRFLFIVETSRAMRPRAQGVFDAMKKALDSSLNGEIRPGDLVGVWTFNENVYQGLFPSQQWSQPTQLAFAVRLQSLADPNTYLRRARLDKVIPEMLKIISETPSVTIIFVTSGEGVMQGTPFSAQINSAWKEWHDEQEGVHMPLLTALRTRNGQPMDWLLVPAPRPIDLPGLMADVRAADEKDSNPSGVILESGQVASKPQPASLAPEQQVAFSVWALGKSSLVNTGVNHSITPSNVVNPTPAAGSSQAAPPVERLSRAKGPKNDSKVEVAVVPSEEQTKSSPPKILPAVNEAAKMPDETPVASVSNDPPGSAKPVELVFVTNTATVPAAVPDRSATPIQPAENPAALELAVASPQPKDVLSGQQLLAQARTANPEEGKRPGFVPAPQRNFLRDNINPLVLMIAATFGAAYCFRMWFLNNARAAGSALSLTRASKPE